ncbi:hypothetical protein D047_1244A, partial [Vibrio parahaemolyticus VPTS-2010_2]
MRKENQTSPTSVFDTPLSA